MNLLVDTHTLIWAATDPDRLSERAAGIVRDPANEVWASAVSGWEIAIKRVRGRLRFPDPDSSMLDELGFRELPVSLSHAARIAALPDHHRDPFDRMLICQAQHERLVLVSKDRVFTQYDVELVW